MSADAEIEAFLRRHLDSVFANDLADYHATTAEDLTLYGGVLRQSHRAGYLLTTRISLAEAH